MSLNNIRTDLAIEIRESFEEDNVEIKGVVVEEEYNKEKEIKITKVIIKTKQGVEAMQKPKGTYITIEAPRLKEMDDNVHREIAQEISKCLMELNKGIGDKEVLILGLGNRSVTPDALGPLAVDNLFVSRHLIKEYGRDSSIVKNIGNVSAIAPGVMAQTGMESGEIIKGIVKEINPDLVIVLDALAARSTLRLNTTIQISNTGISPGSGVGNHRIAINQESLGVPVIAIGVPTVVDAATIAYDTMDSILDAISQMGNQSQNSDAEESKECKTQSISNVINSFSEEEKYQLVKELTSSRLGNMFVTPKDVDDTIKRMSFTLSESLNMTFHH